MKTQQTRRNEQAWKKWQGLLSEQSQSGQSVAAFCRERGQSVSLFYYWRQRLNEATTTKFLEVKVAASAPAQTDLRDQAIEVRVRHGRSLLVAPGFDANHLRALLAVVESA